MPNTLVHFAAQGAASHGLWRRLDPRWIYLGCLLPDLPWILRRALVGLGVPVDPFDLRLYTMAQASFFGTLLLAAALALATLAPRRVFAVLGLNALLHLLLDATEIKFGNGVHLFAPLSWRMTSFDLLPGESLLYGVLTLAGALVVAWEVARPCAPADSLERRPARLAAAAAFLAAYFLAPLPFLSAIEASDSYSVQTLRAADARPGRAVSLDRAAFRATPAGGFVRLWTGEEVRATGELPAHDAIVSLHGTFVERDVLRVETLHVQRGDRDWPSYLGLALLALVFGRAALSGRAGDRHELGGQLLAYTRRRSRTGDLRRPDERSRAHAPRPHDPVPGRRHARRHPVAPRRRVAGLVPALFSRQAGGGGALVGISWLAPVFGAWFGWALVRSGERPARLGVAFGLVLLAIALMPASGFAAIALGMNGQSPAILGVYAVVSIVGLVLAFRAWPGLGRVLLAYGLAARVPVVLVMLAAILGNWGTHYDALPPGAPDMAPIPKWLLIGVLPQMTVWLWFTSAIGGLFGLVAGALAGRRPAA